MFRRRRAVPPSAPRAVAGPMAAPAHRHDVSPIDGVETPYVLRFSAAWSWRLLLVVAAIYVFLHVFSLLSVVLVPVIIGLLISAALSPLADRLVQWNLPRSLATMVVVVGAIALIAALVALVAQQFSSGFGDLRSSFDDSLDKLEDYLTKLGLSQQQLSDFFDKVQEGVQSGQGNLGGTVVKTATTAGHLIAGLFIMLFATIFFTYDGRGIWRWLVSPVPRARPRPRARQRRARVGGAHGVRTGHARHRRDRRAGHLAGGTGPGAAARRAAGRPGVPRRLHPRRRCGHQWHRRRRRRPGVGRPRHRSHHAGRRGGGAADRGPRAAALPHGPPGAGAPARDRRRHRGRAPRSRASSAR